MDTSEEDAFTRELDMKSTDYYRNLKKAKEAKSQKKVIEKNSQSIHEENKEY